MTTNKHTVWILAALATFSLPSLAGADGLATGLLFSSQRCGQVRSITDRRTADGLLKRARQAIEQGNLELADWYVKRAEALDVTYDSVFQRFVDTPEKVREAMEIMRRTGQAPPAPEVAGPNGGPTDSTATQRKVTKSPQEIAEAAKAAVMNAEAEAARNAKGQAARYLQNGRLALAEGDIKEAVAWYQKSLLIEATFEPNEYSTESLADALQQYGVDTASLLAAASARREQPDDAIDATGGLVDPATLRHDARQKTQTAADAKVPSNELLSRGKGIAEGSTQMPTASAYQETMRLLSEAQVALDRGELKVAETLAQQAQNLRLPDQSYEVGDPRPWMILMEISRRQERVQSYPQSELTTSIAPPPTPQGVPGVVIPSGYDPLSNPSRVTPAQATMPSPPMTAQQQAAPAYTYPPQPNGAMPNAAWPSSQPSPPADVPAQRTPVSPNWSPAPADTFTQPQPPPSRTPGPQMIANPTVQSGLSSSGLSSSGFPADNLSSSGAAPSALAPIVTSPQSSPNRQGTGGRSHSPEMNEPGTISTFGETVSAPAPDTATDPLDASEFELPTPSPLSPTPRDKNVTTIDDDDIVSQQKSPGETLFQEGELALSSQRRTVARELFREAWKYEKELSPETRQRLQDHLQSLAGNETPAPAAELVEPNVLSSVEKEEARKVISEMSKRQATISAMKDSDPMDAWEKLKELREFVASSKVDEKTRQRLLQRVDRTSADLENYISINRAKIENDERNKKIIAEIDRTREQRVRNQQRLAELVDQFNQLIDQQRFPEASVIAKQAAELDPLNPVVQSILWKSNVARQVASNLKRTQQFESNALQMLDDVADSAVPMEGDIMFPDVRYWDELTKSRRELMAEKKRQFSDVELEIQQALKKPVDVQFEDTPLSTVLERLSQMTGVNIFLDPEGLSAEGVTGSTTVSLSLRKPVQFKSALNLILQPLHLSYIVQNEVLRITSEQVRDSDIYPKVYPVADLVIPIPSFGPGNHLGLPAALREAYALANSSADYGGYKQRPFTLAADGGAPTEASVLAQMGIGSNGMNPGQNMGFAQPGQGGGGVQADFDTLIELITRTVSPESWEDVGGTGTIAEFPTNLSLVVAQTQEVHEKIVDLLAQLRRLQDLQVTIEVRFITLNDNFFERIGVDFDFNIVDNSGLTQADIINRANEDLPSVTIGLDPSGARRWTSILGSRKAVLERPLRPLAVSMPTRQRISVSPSSAISRPSSSFRPPRGTREPMCSKRQR